ncbi:MULTISPECIES: hypothetical protein [unclassified Okeania]|nr:MULTISPECIES: hypothetical protein [unclassified Okeania]NEN87768.1 hypothetical protein [Okeania sp. SIO3H1]NET29808.1 hypothetical protein [Okeania sp. SIO1I7]NET43977.1 hypothetical protein [Okeania sp. SIO2B3]
MLYQKAIAHHKILDFRDFFHYSLTAINIAEIQNLLWQIIYLNLQCYS